MDQSLINVAELMCKLSENVKLSWSCSVTLTVSSRLLLRYRCGVSPHRRRFVANSHESRASPPAVQPTTPGHPPGALSVGEARPSYEVKTQIMISRQPEVSSGSLVVTRLSLSSFRYSVWSRGSSVELRVDLLFLFQSLQEAAGGAGGAGGGPSLVNMRRVAFSSKGDRLQDTAGDVWGVTGILPFQELGLVLGCTRAGSRVSCEAGGVHLSHTPFMALYHRWTHRHRTEICRETLHVPDQPAAGSLGGNHALQLQIY